MNRREDAAIEELAKLLDGELTADEANAPVRQLAVLASAVTESEAVPRPTPAFRAALRNSLVADIEASEVGVLERAREAVWHRTARIRHSLRVATATAAASGLIGTAGVAAAAQQALPGELLYGVKQGTESIRLAFAGDDLGQGRTHLALAERRLEELDRGLPGLSDDEVVDTLDRMDGSTVDGANALIEAVEAGTGSAVLDELIAFSSRQREGLTAIYDDLPAGARPFADDSLEVLRRVDTQVTIALDPTCSQCGEGEEPVVSLPAPPPADRPDPVTRPGDGPAVPDRPRCDCVEVEAPAPPRDPGLLPGDGEPDPPVEPEPSEPTGEPEPAPEPTEEDGRVVVPPLPGPLDPVGEAVDDIIEELLELGQPVTPAPSDVPDVDPPVATDPELPDPPAATATEPAAQPSTEPEEQPADVGDLLDPGA